MDVYNIENLSSDVLPALDKTGIATLIALGSNQGFVTHDDILRIIPETYEDSGLLDDVLTALMRAQVPYVFEKPGEQNRQDDEIVDANNPAHVSNGNPLANIQTDDLVSLYFSEAARVPLLTQDEEVDLAKRIERGRIAREELSRGNPGTRRREDLLRLIEDGWEAREHLIRANSRLVISIAKKYTGRGVPFLDIIQEGNIGLMRSIKKFDYSKGYKFSTYATWWIRQAISRAVATQGRTIRVPVHTIDQITRLLRIKRQLLQSLQRDPTVEELAEALEIPQEKVKALLKAARHPFSLEQPINADGDTVLGDMIENESTPEPDETASQNLLRQHIRETLNELPPREARVLELRYGLSDGKCYTMQEIGEKMGVTRERIRQIEAQALRRLRKPRIVQGLRGYFEF